MIRSLRARLFVGMTVVIVLAGCAGGTFAYFSAVDEAIEMEGSMLVQHGSLVRGGGFDSGQPLRGVDEDAEVVIIELGTAPHGSAEDRQPFSLQDGLRLASRKGHPIRVLLRTRTDGSRFAVAQRTAIREEIAQELALRTLVPIAALVPCLMLITALVIARSLRPVVRLARDLDTRPADDMRELPAARTPITALSLQAENLEPVALSVEGRDRLAALRDGMSRTKHLLEQLLALARQETGLPEAAESIALDQLAKEVVADLLPEATRRGV